MNPQKLDKYLFNPKSELDLICIIEINSIIWSKFLKYSGLNLKLSLYSANISASPITPRPIFLILICSFYFSKLDKFKSITLSKHSNCYWNNSFNIFFCINSWKFIKLNYKQLYLHQFFFFNDYKYFLPFILSSADTLFALFVIPTINNN